MSKTSASPVDQAWIVTELERLIEAERAFVGTARQRIDSTALAALATLYHQLADTESNHVNVLERVAVRYGHTPTREHAGGVGGTLGRLKDQIVGYATQPWDLVSQDVTALATQLGWLEAWAGALEAIGDTESAAELAAVASEERAQQAALVEGLRRLLLDRLQQPPA